MPIDEWALRTADAIELAKNRLYEDFGRLHGDFFWKEEDVQSYFFRLLLSLEPFRSDISADRLSIHREYPTKSHYRRCNGKSMLEKISRGTNNQRGSFDLVIIHPKNTGYSTDHPILHGIEIKYPRDFSSGFSGVWLRGLTRKIYPDYVKLTDEENGIHSKDNRHLICILRRERLPRELSIEKITQAMEGHRKFRGKINLKELRFSLVAFDDAGERRGPFKNYRHGMSTC